jgi:hypothetical protein
MKPITTRPGYGSDVHLDMVNNSFTIPLPVRKTRSAWAAHSYIECPPVRDREICTGRVKYYYVDDELCYCDKCNLAILVEDFKLLFNARLEQEALKLKQRIDPRIEQQIDKITQDAGSAEESLIVLRELQATLLTAENQSDYVIVKEFADAWKDILF